MKNKTILAIDCGTQSLRAMIFSVGGELLSKIQVEYAPCFRPHSGWAEQDPELYWESLAAACNKLKQSVPQYFASVKGMGITTQRNTMVNVDKDGKVLRPAIVWMDQRQAQPVWG